jgi:hypothetical protein
VSALAAKMLTLLKNGEKIEIVGKYDHRECKMLRLPRVSGCYSRIQQYRGLLEAC